MNELSGFLGKKIWRVKENAYFRMRSDNKCVIVYKKLISGYITGTPDRLGAVIRKYVLNFGQILVRLICNGTFSWYA